MWAETESNPHSQRRLIYSHRKAHGDRDMDFLAFRRSRSGQTSISAKSQLPTLFSTEPGG